MVKFGWAKRQRPAHQRSRLRSVQHASAAAITNLQYKYSWCDDVNAYVFSFATMPRKQVFSKFLSHITIYLFFKIVVRHPKGDRNFLS